MAVGITITDMQTAVTLYTLVMAMLMITGGKIGSMIGRRRAFAIECVIYGLGSLTTALAPTTVGRTPHTRQGRTPSSTTWAS